MLKALIKIDDFLLPNTDEFRLGPYIWLLYLSIFFIGLFNHPQTEHPYIYASLGVLVFLFLYFHGHRTTGKKLIIDMLGILIVGSLMANISQGASVFFVFSAAFSCRLGAVSSALWGIALVVIWVAALSFLFDYHMYFYGTSIFFSIMIGGINIYYSEIERGRQELKLSKQETRDLAKVAERERIARDLHDVIGHTFSVITLKSELAAKLIELDTDKAKKEITELGQISRDALKQVREVVSGYRTSDLNTELAYAKYVLESNSINFDYKFDDFEMNDALNKELAIILKELVTNVLKHAEATQAKASIFLEQHTITLHFQDNGKGLANIKSKGFGLKGMHERVESLSGSLSYTTNSGAVFTINVPNVRQP